MKQLYNGSDHKTFGPPEPPDYPEDSNDRKRRLRGNCPALDAEEYCEVNGYCLDHSVCPMGKW